MPLCAESTVMPTSRPKPAPGVNRPARLARPGARTVTRAARTDTRGHGHTTTPPHTKKPQPDGVKGYHPSGHGSHAAALRWTRRSSVKGGSSSGISA
ncbi:hypothetical protein GCM10018773_45450 [Streptomyces candidus]|nr:hypothetical protein GCM10018773_45450 [Streptomyces candidus]